MKIIGLTGYARSGKGTVAQLITSAVGSFTEVTSFAAPMKNFCAELFGFNFDQLYGDKRDDPDPRWTRPDGTPLTSRFALQTLGTEWGRGCDPDIWVKSGLRRAANSASDVVIFDDVRFLNEAKAIRKAGGELWRIRRGDQQRPHAHSSEADIWSEAMGGLVTLEIDNSGTIDDLRWAVRRGMARLHLGRPCED